MGISIAIPFIMRGFSKRDNAFANIHKETEKQYQTISQRLDRYEERLREAEMQIIRNGNAINAAGAGDHYDNKEW